MYKFSCTGHANKPYPASCLVQSLSNDQVEMLIMFQSCYYCKTGRIQTKHYWFPCILFAFRLCLLHTLPGCHLIQHSISSRWEHVWHGKPGEEQSTENQVWKWSGVHMRKHLNITLYQHCTLYQVTAKIWEQGKVQDQEVFRGPHGFIPCTNN